MNVLLKLKKIIAILLIASLLTAHVPYAIAEEGTDAYTQPVTTQTEPTPSEQSAPVAESHTAPQAPEAPVLTTTPPPAPTLTVTPPQAPTLEQATQQAQQSQQQVAQNNTNSSDDDDKPKEKRKKKAKEEQSAAATATPAPSASATSDPAADNVGSSSVCSSCSGSSAGVINSGNGSKSNNNGSATDNNDNTTSQNNSAAVRTGVTASAVTGSNKANDNMGGNVELTSGKANVSGTAVSELNTNMAGVSVSEFNVNDVQRGDLVLDFDANCIQNCNGEGFVKNANNGNGSTNNASSTTNNNDETFQNNDATVGNDLTLSADSGNNRAKDNMGGDVSITSGDANISANSLTFANNNIEGNVKYGVVNIYGDLYGDIILPEEEVSGGSATVANQNNGRDSENNTAYTQNNNNATTQGNNATITNNLNIDANTGENKASDNDTSTITSGESNIKANVLNVANSNIDGTWWLVIVNEAGKWVGKLVGSPDGSHMGGSEGTEFTVNENGEITASNSGNDRNSTNNNAVAENNNSSTTQNNNANIVNNLNLTGNTGANNASDNMGGKTDITTGNVNIIANLVNFVNNNIIGDGKLVVTVINVFGNWFGNFVGPGQQKEQANQQNQVAQAQNSNSSNSSNSGSSSSTQTGVQNGVALVNTATSNNTNTNILGAATKNTGITAGIANGSVQIAGINSLLDKPTTVVESINAQKKITINLAWIILALPIAGLFVLRKKAFRLLPKKA